VERLLELEELVIEVMADLVHEGAQERLERDDLPLRRRAHPDGDSSGRPTFFGFVEAMEFAIIVGGALREHPQPDRRHAIACHQRID
jgi:hypothetical protein